MAWLVQDKETTQRLIRESLLQLCRVNISSSGTYEVDAIVCISGSGKEEEQLIVRIHELVSREPPGYGHSKEGDASLLREYLSTQSVPNSKLTSDRLTNKCLKRRVCDENANAVYSGISGTSEVLNKLMKYATIRANNLKEEHLDFAEDVRKHEVVNHGTSYTCGPCFVKFPSYALLESHFGHSHQTQLKWFCDRCDIGYTLEEELAEHRVKSHGSQRGNTSSSRRKQTNPRKGVADEDGAGMDNGLTAKQSTENQVQGELVPYRESTQNFDSLDQNDGVIKSLLKKQPTILHETATSSPKNAVSYSHDTSMLPKTLKISFKHSTVGLPPMDMLVEDDAEKRLKCPHCEIEFDNFQNLGEHCQNLHKRYACPYCLLTFTQRVNRERHLYYHTGEKPFTCAECGLGFTRRDALKKHQQRSNHFAKGGSPTAAISSPLDEDNGMDLDQGILHDAGDDVRNSQREEECGLDLSLTSSQNMRLKLENSQSSLPLSVENDSFLFDEDKPQDRRMSSKLPLFDSGAGGSDEENASAYSSQNASEPGSQLADLDPKRPFSCDQCREILYGSTAFREHCRTYHRRTPCIHCGKTFSQKGNMERHRRQHTGERPFACPYCSCSYTRRETLKSHLNQAHGDQERDRLSEIESSYTLVPSDNLVRSENLLPTENLVLAVKMEKVEEKEEEEDDEAAPESNTFHS